MCVAKVAHSFKAFCGCIAIGSTQPHRSVCMVKAITAKSLSVALQSDPGAHLAPWQRPHRHEFRHWRSGCHKQKLGTALKCMPTDARGQHTCTHTSVGSAGRALAQAGGAEMQLLAGRAQG